MDNTGRWRDVSGQRAAPEPPGISRVLLTAPGKGRHEKNIVFGVYDNVITDEDKDPLRSILHHPTRLLRHWKVLDDAYGVERGHVETVRIHQRSEPDRQLPWVTAAVAPLC